MQKFFFALILLYGQPGAASGQIRTPQELRWRLHSVQQQSFPELEGRSLELGSFEEADSFFQSQFEFWSLFGSRPRYRIEVNPRLLELGCPPEAIDAVLAHELGHTLDYDQEGLPGLFKVLSRLLIDPRGYEHRTDLQAIFRGYGSGLALYREWIYAQLTPEQVERKRYMYYQPAEIRLLMSRLSELDFAARKRLEAQWLAQPPLTPAEILAKVE